MTLVTEKTRFQTDGLVCVPGAINKNKVLAAKNEIFRQLERLKYRESGKWQTRALDSLPPFNASTKVSQAIGPSPLFDHLIDAELVSRALLLAELPAQTEQTRPQLLVTLPQKHKWEVPFLGWHVDISEPKDRSIPGIQIFILIDDIEPRGGGTLVVAGAHRFREFNPTATSSIHALKEEPYFSGLFQHDQDRKKYMEPRKIGDIALRVVELTGRCGDAFVMDMRLPHAPAINESKNARMMLTTRLLKPSKTKPR